MVGRIILTKKIDQETFVQELRKKCPGARINITAKEIEVLAGNLAQVQVFYGNFPVKIEKKSAEFTLQADPSDIALLLEKDSNIKVLLQDAIQSTLHVQTEIVRIANTKLWDAVNSKLTTVLSVVTKAQQVTEEVDTKQEEISADFKEKTDILELVSKRIRQDISTLQQEFKDLQEQLKAFTTDEGYARMKKFLTLLKSL